jgi:spermidine/putrescine-binding protein
MKKSILILSAAGMMAAALAMSHPVQAQDQKQRMADLLKSSTPEQRAKMQTQMITTRLNLDSATGIKVYEVNLNAAQKMEPVLKGDGGGKLAVFRKIKSIDADKDKAFKAIFTPEQYKAYQAAKQEMKEKMQQKMQERKAAKG